MLGQLSVTWLEVRNKDKAISAARRPNVDSGLVATEVDDAGQPPIDWNPHGASCLVPPGTIAVLNDQSPYAGIRDMLFWIPLARRSTSASTPTASRRTRSCGSRPQ